LQGKAGKQGKTGAKGEPGRDGTNGKDGKRGPQGPVGPIGKTPAHRNRQEKEAHFVLRILMVRGVSGLRCLRVVAEEVGSSCRATTL